MIPLATEDFFFVLILLGIFPIGILWARDLWRQVSRHWEPSEDKIVNCPFCQYTFFVRPRRQVAMCPACKQSVRVRLPKDKHIKY